MKTLFLQVFVLILVGELHGTKLAVSNFYSYNGIDDKQLIKYWSEIFPGTKWCGPGNVAENYDDLGIQVETDKCCRAHDLCDDIIEAGGSKHNLTNSAFFTRLSCQCDEQFHDCLITGSTITSDTVGYIYFNLLGQQCFKEDFPVVGCINSIFYPTEKCVEYEYDTSKDKKYQWFDVQIY